MFFRILGWILRIVAIICLSIGGYLAYQFFFQDTSPQQAIDALVDTAQEGYHKVDQGAKHLEESTSKTVAESGSSSSQPQVCYGSTCYNVAIADSPSERQRGLMFVKSLPQDQGMLFVFEQSAPHTFWMKNTKLTLDMIWLDENYQILYIQDSAPPCESDPCPTYGPDDAQALYVLEINGGLASQWSVGEKMTFKN